MNSPPSFAIVTMGSGDFLGSTVRDLALANALHRRGYKVAVYWMMEENQEMAAPEIRQRTLCHGTRYHFKRPSELLDRVLGSALFLLPKKLRVKIVQGRNGYVDRLLGNLVSSLYGQPAGDPALARRLLRYIAADQVSHLVLSFASLGPLALAAKVLNGPAFDYLLTFQGDEQFAAYARRQGIGAPYAAQLNAVLRQSPWPAIAVSADYVERIVEELEVPRAALDVIYNGIDLPPLAAKPPFAMLRTLFPALREDIPIVLYLGRQDCEKGIDLLLYAARLLALRKVPMQLVICGSTALGRAYRGILDTLGEHLGLPFFHGGTVSNELRSALYAHSRVVVYPSINREPFGLVAAEAMSHGTPVLVPDYGGIGEVIQQRGKAGGLTFKTWDSGDLARQLERLLGDEKLYRALADNTRGIAARFSVDRMTDDILAHMDLSRAAQPVPLSVV
jgi:glycosyltransferase involved in cell wall biosynthesis